jgi:hypothetical protein
VSETVTPQRDTAHCSRSVFAIWRSSSASCSQKSAKASRSLPLLSSALQSTDHNCCPLRHKPLVGRLALRADIGFARKGPFEACLDGAYDAWLKAQAEFLVNEDRRAKSLDDAAAAAWTAAALDACRKKGAVEAGSVDRFGRYMARWRDHVFDHADSIRRRGQSD